MRKIPKPMSMLMESAPEDTFYLQDSRTYTGNCVLWWRAGGNGYTSDLSEAGIFWRQEALAKFLSRATDIPWPKNYIDSIARPRVDMQVMKMVEAYPALMDMPK